ncbi:MAG: Ig-like domain-containing protein, partial [Syntrophales bacterium]|nr:Ig-like domain-containing protein [Syntrophales bacterium]
MNITSVAFTPDGRYAISADQVKTLRLWDVTTGREIRTFRGHTDLVHSVAVSPDGKYVLSGSEDKTLKLWDIDTGREIRTFEGHTKRVDSVAISPDGKYALSGSWDYTLKLWNMATGREIRTFKRTGGEYSGWVAAVAFSPDQRFVVSCGQDSDIVIWDMASGREIQKLKGKFGWNKSVAISPNGKYVSSAGGSVNLWDTATGKYLNNFKIGHRVNAVVFSPDGRYLLTGSQDAANGAIGLWNVETGTEIKTFKGHKGEVMSLAFSPKGEFFISASHDGSIRLWDVNTGREIIQLISFTDGEWIAMTPEGYFNASANGAKYLNVRVGNKVYSIDNFSERFFNPVYVASVLQGEKVATVADIRKGILTPPDVRITSPAPGSQFNTDTLTVTVAAKDTGGGIDEIRLYHNGKAIGEDTRAVKIVSRGSEAIREYTVSLVDGVNTFR